MWAGAQLRASTLASLPLEGQCGSSLGTPDFRLWIEGGEVRSRRE